VHQFEKSFRQTLDIAAHLITDSAATRQEVIEYFGWPAERVTSVNLGVSASFAPRSPAELLAGLRHYGLAAGAYCLCVSTIEPRKGIGNLLAAYSRLPEAVRNAHPLVLVGGVGWRSEHLHLAIETGQKAGWLRYLGFVPECDLPLLYAGARLFVYPSSYEGFGLPVVEAMASGVPVITSDRSCLPEVAGGAAKLINPDDVVGLSTAIESCLLDLNWQAQAISDGLQVAARYNWEGCLRRTVEIYRSAGRGGA
jgi:alpha-1,3-rhamnosyl/mannosyltransferase